MGTQVHPFPRTNSECGIEAKVIQVYKELACGRIVRPDAPFLRFLTKPRRNSSIKGWGMNEHEIASSVLAIVDDAAYHNAATRISGLHLAIGGRRVFDPVRLQTTFAEDARGTVAEGAQLFVKVLPVEHHCQNCGLTFEAGSAETACPKCNHPHTEMLGGEELRLLDMELDDVA